MERISTATSSATIAAGVTQILGVIPDVVGCVGVLVGIWLSFRMIQKVTAEREKLQLEKKKLQLEIDNMKEKDKTIISP